MNECRLQVEVCNLRGLHARAAAKIATLAEEFKIEVVLSFAGQSVSALSIMGMMMLGASKGSILTLSASGEGADAAVEQLAGLIGAGFNEHE